MVQFFLKEFAMANVKSVVVENGTVVIYTTSGVVTVDPQKRNGYLVAYNSNKGTQTKIIS